MKFLIFLLTIFYGCSSQRLILQSNFIFEEAPFVSCHASSLVQTETGILAVWFAGTKEGASDVKIWSSRYESMTWSAPKIIADEKGIPTWNPVLFKPKKGDLLLFYKKGKSPKQWKGVMRTSNDDGLTWSQPLELPSGIIGPSKNKPIELKDGTLLHPSSTESNGWQVHLETSDLTGTHWKRQASLKSKHSVIQPTILQYADNKLQILMRSSRTNFIMESWSFNDGRSWSPVKETNLPNPNSGIDGLILADGRAILIYNDSTQERSSLSLALSNDQGQFWKKVMSLENEDGQEFSYPAVIQTPDGMIHISYTWKRVKIKHLEIDPASIK